MGEDLQKYYRGLATSTLIAFGSSLPIVSMMLWVAAFVGMNFVASLFVFLSTAGSVGLLAGTFTAFLKRPSFVWVTALSASIIALLSLMILSDPLFVLARALFGQASEEQIYNPLYIAHLPHIVLTYGALSLATNIAVIWLCFKSIRS